MPKYIFALYFAIIPYWENVHFAKWSPFNIDALRLFFSFFYQSTAHSFGVAIAKVRFDTKADCWQNAAVAVIN